MLFVCTLDTIIVQNTADVKHAFTADDVRKIGKIPRMHKHAEDAVVLSAD